MLNANADIENSPDPFGDQTPSAPTQDPEIVKSPDPFAKPAKESKADVLRRISKEEGIDDPTPILSIGNQELGNSMKPTVSGAGAAGGMQVLPSTGLQYVTPQEWGTDEGKMRAGVRYYKDLLKQFGGNEQQAIAGYFTGQGNVNKAVAKGANLPNTLDPISNLRTPSYVNQVQQKIDKNTPDEIKSSPDPFGDVSDDVKNSPDPFAAPTVNVGAPGRNIGPPMTPQQQAASEPWRQQPADVELSGIDIAPTANLAQQLAQAAVAKDNEKYGSDVTKGIPLNVPFSSPEEFRGQLYSKLGLLGVAKAFKERGLDLIDFGVPDEELLKGAQQFKSASVGGQNRSSIDVKVSPYVQRLGKLFLDTFQQGKAAGLSDADAKDKAFDAYYAGRAKVKELMDQPDITGKQLKENVAKQLPTFNAPGSQSLSYTPSVETAGALTTGLVQTGQAQEQFAHDLGLSTDASEEALKTANQMMASPEFQDFAKKSTTYQNVVAAVPSLAVDLPRLATEAMIVGPGAFNLDAALHNLHKPMSEQVMAQAKASVYGMIPFLKIPAGALAGTMAQKALQTAFESSAFAGTAGAESIQSGQRGPQVLSSTLTMGLLPLAMSVFHGAEPPPEVKTRLTEGLNNAELQHALIDYGQNPTPDRAAPIKEALGKIGLNEQQATEFIDNLTPATSTAKPEPLSPADQLAAEKKSASSTASVTGEVPLQGNTTTPESLHRQFAQDAIDTAARNSQNVGDFAERLSALTKRYTGVNVPRDTLSRVLSDNGLTTKDAVDSASTNPKFVSDFLERVTTLPEFNGIRQRPDALTSTPGMMQGEMGARTQNLKVGDKIIKPVSVDMVNNLRSQEGASDVPLHDDAMLKYLPAINAENTIPRASVPLNPSHAETLTQGENYAKSLRSNQEPVNQTGNVEAGGRTESGPDLQQREKAGTTAGDTEQRQEEVKQPEKPEPVVGQVFDYRNQKYRVESVDDEHIRAVDLSGKEGMRVFQRDAFDRITTPPVDTREYRTPEEATADRVRAQGPRETVEPPKSASVKAFITKADEAALKARGYSDGDIYKMKPDEAQRILESPQPIKPGDTLTHDNPDLHGKEVLAVDSQGRAVVANPDNADGVSRVKDQSEAKPNEQTTATVQPSPAPDFDRETRNVSDALNDDEHPFSKAIDRVAAGDTSPEAINAVRAAGAGFDPATVEDAIDGATRVANKQPTESPGPRSSETPEAPGGVGEPGKTVEPPKPPEFERTAKPPSEASAADKVDENQHWNFKRSQFSSAESEQAFRDLIKKTVAENGEAHKTRVTQKDFVARVNEIDPELAKEAIKNYKPGDPVPSREIFHAAAEYAQNNMREAMETRKFLRESGDDISATQRQQLEDHAARLEHDALQVAGGAIGVRSEFGRNLALLATMKMDKDSAAYQVRRADAAAKARGDDLTGKDWQIQRDRIRDLGVKLEQAKMERDDALQKLSEGTKGKRRAAEESKSLSEFVRAKGGFKSDKDLQGEINRLRSKESGTTGLFGKKGLSPDYMREAAVEAGYLPEDATISDLMDKVEQDLRGQKVHSIYKDQAFLNKELEAAHKKARPEDYQTWQQRFTSKLDKLEQDARARLSSTFNPNQLNDITVLIGRSADLAIILASKIAKKLVSLTEMRKQMTDEFGDHFTKDQDRIERAALEIHNDQKVATLAESAKSPDKEVRKSALSELKAEVAKRDQAEKQAVKEAESVKKNLEKFNAESRAQVQRNADAAEKKAVAAEARAKDLREKQEQRAKDAAAAQEQRYKDLTEKRQSQAEQFQAEQQQRAKSKELGAAEDDAVKARQEADRFNAESKQQQAKAEENLRKQQDATDARESTKKARQAQRDAEVNEQKAIRVENARQKTAAAQEANPVYQLGVEGKATQMRLDQSGEPATPDDLAKIGAAKLHEPGMTAARWTAEMQKFGKAFTDNQRVVREQSAKLSSDAKDQVKTQQRSRTAAASDAYNAALKQGKTIPEAKAAAREARANTGALTDEQLAKLKDDYNQAHAKVLATQRELAKNFANLEESNLEKASNAIKMGLIFGGRTLGKIALSHLSYGVMETAAKIPASVADMVQSALNGNERQAGGLSLDMIRSAGMMAIRRGVPDAWVKLKTGYFPEGEDVYSRVQGASNPLEARELHFNSNSKVLDAYAKTLNANMRVHGAVYSIHRVAMVDMALKEQAALTARTEAKAALKAGTIQSTDVADYTRQRALDLYKKPPETMAAIAIGSAEESSFVNPNLTNKFIQSTKTQAGSVPGVGPLLKFGIDRLAGFSKVPANVVARTVEGIGPISIPYAVLRLGLRALQEKGYTPEMQAQFSKTVGRGTVGALGPMLLGYALAASGRATGFIQNQDKNGSVTILGRQWRTSAIPPFGTLMALGATVYEMQHFPISTDNSIGAKTYGKAALSAAKDTVLEQPLVHELHTFDDLTGSDDVGHTAKKIVGGMAGQVVPTIVSDTAAQIDRTKRQKDSIMSYVQERVPGWRNFLPASPYPGQEPNKLFDPFASIPSATSPAHDTPDIKPFVPEKAKKYLYKKY